MLALLPTGVSVGELAGRGLSPGLLSAGLQGVPAAQTYLDISQGNRVFDSLYSSKLPAEAGCGRGFWRAVKERAASAPADIVPGLLTSTLRAAGIGVRVGGEASLPGNGGRVGGGASCTFSAPEAGTAAHATPEKLSGTPHPATAPTFEVRSSSLAQLRSLVGGLRGDDLLIAIERPPPAKDRALAIAIAGRGFDGNLTSDSTRLNGYVLSTDIAPTILQRFGVAVPSEMSGQPIRAEGRVDAAAVAELGDRLATIPERRGPVIGLGLLVWLAALGLAIAVTRGRAARLGLRLAGLSVVYLPLVLLLVAALEPSLGTEQLLAIAGAPLLGLVTAVALRGYRAVAVACGLTVLAYAIDVVAGSPLTSLSLLGPNPGLGVRFYGIGNELEALLTVLVVAGTGAVLTGFAPRLPARGCAIAFLATGLVLAFVFGAGRFGADVGAAIVLPFGSAVAAATIAARRRRTALLVVAAPLVAVALLAIVDLLSGANAHLTRSILDAGGFSDLAKVAQRRLQLSSHSFGRPIVLVFMPILLVAIGLTIVGRRRVGAWLRRCPAMRAGLLGALAATLVGTLANDSGALVLEIGAVYLLAFVAFAWAERQQPDAGRPIDYA